MSAQKIVTDLAKKHYKPVYWLEGEEEYFIDEVIHYAEHEILAESEASFNLTVFYGRDADWAAILNACRRYPMFAERQVVIIKEAQDMKGIEKLESYVEKPLVSTLLFVAYKGKKLDGRTRLSKLLKDKAVHFISKKLYDSELPEWTTAMVKSRGLTITGKALNLVVDHIGNDLNRLKNEIDKLALNLGSRKHITDDDVEKYIGISKEELAKTVDVASTFTASNIQIKPIQEKRGGKEKETTTAKRVDKLVISFDVENRVARSGPADIYVIVTAPNGQVISSTELGSGTLTTRNDGEKQFTSKVTAEYEQGTRKNVQVPLRQGGFQTGDYRIEIYQNGFKIAEGVRSLKKGGLFS